MTSCAATLTSSNPAALRALVMTAPMSRWDDADLLRPSLAFNAMDAAELLPLRLQYPGFLQLQVPAPWGSCTSGFCASGAEMTTGQPFIRLARNGAFSSAGFCASATEVPQSPANLRDAIARRDPDVEQKRPAGKAIAVLMLPPMPPASAVRHAGDHLFLDDCLARCIRPCTVRISVDRVAGCPDRTGPHAHSSIKLYDLARIHGLDRGIGAAVPHGNFRPRAAMRRRIADQIAPFASRPRLSLEHAFEASERWWRVIGQACDDGTAGEHLRIGRQHGRCHRSAGGKAGVTKMRLLSTPCHRTACSTIWRIECASPWSRSMSPG